VDLSPAKSTKERTEMNDEKTPLTALEDELSNAEFTVVSMLGSQYKILKKFPRLKFLRLVTSDPAAAIQLVLPPAEYDRLEDVVLTNEDLETVLEGLSLALTGGPKN
jgi:hypothetical protein